MAKVIEGYNTDERLRTVFSSSEEARKYLEILGAEQIDEKTYRFGKTDDENRSVICTIDNEWNLIKLPGILEFWINDLFKRYGMEEAYGANIADLESLVAIYLFLMGDDIEECYASHLAMAKYEMLSHIVSQRESIKFEGPFAGFDRAVAPFLSDDFDISKFLGECVFNTTGFYEYDGNQCLSFEWRTKKEPDIAYKLDTARDWVQTYIGNENDDNRFGQSAYHTINGDKETVNISHNNGGVQTFYRHHDKTIGGLINHDTVIPYSEATEDDIDILVASMDSFIDPNLSFDKSKGKKKVEKEERR